MLVKLQRFREVDAQTLVPLELHPGEWPGHNQCGAMSLRKVQLQHFQPIRIFVFLMSVSISDT